MKVYLAVFSARRISDPYVEYLSNESQIVGGTCDSVFGHPVWFSNWRFGFNGF